MLAYHPHMFQQYTPPGTMEGGAGYQMNGRKVPMPPKNADGHVFPFAYPNYGLVHANGVATGAAFITPVKLFGNSVATGKPSGPSDQDRASSGAAARKLALDKGTMTPQSSQANDSDEYTIITTVTSKVIPSPRLTSRSVGSSISAGSSPNIREQVAYDAPHIPKLKLPVWEESSSTTQSQFGGTTVYHSPRANVPTGPSGASSPGFSARSMSSHNHVTKMSGRSQTARSIESGIISALSQRGATSVLTHTEASPSSNTWTLSHANLASHVRDHKAPEKKGAASSSAPAERDVDLHSIYTASVMEFEANRRERVWVGLGITFKQDPETGEMCIHHIVPGGGAARCGGVKKGDVLVEIDGEDISSMEPEHMSRLFVGKEGSKVYLGVRRPPSETLLRYCIVRCKQQSNSGTRSVLSFQTEDARSLQSGRTESARILLN